MTNESGASGRATPEELREKLDRALDRGRADVRAGRVTPAEEVFARLEMKYRKMAEEKAKATGKE
ncbi:MAG TPA: hypothetical protein VK630_20010 [Reyranella sp.]|nr:hypothetical protein [Reyranella sp.]